VLLPALLLILLLLTLNVSALWIRYLNGRLLTPSGGLHLQILIFFCIGGLSFLAFPSADRRLYEDEVADLIFNSCIPLLLGYAISCALELRSHRKAKGGEVRPINQFSADDLMALLAIGFAGTVLGTVTEGFTANVVAAYMALLFFPSILLCILNTNEFGGVRLPTTVLVLLTAAIIGFFSPWRSVLVILAATLLLGISLCRPRWLPGVSIVGFLAVSVLLPFQVIKRDSFAEFQAAPLQVIATTLEINYDERLSMVGEFAAKRLNYVRELVYVDLALEAGFEPKWGDTYAGALKQLVPRALWPDKPALAEWAGFDLPREIGLVEGLEGTTSWAVNMFAESAYNFGIWSLIWFVPLSFSFAEWLSRLLGRFYQSDKARAVGNVAAFYLLLATTTTIFMASLVVALLLIVKVLDLWFMSRSGTPSPGLR
jgi:hypothetical protein